MTGNRSRKYPDLASARSALGLPLGAAPGRRNPAISAGCWQPPLDVKGFDTSIDPLLVLATLEAFDGRDDVWNRHRRVDLPVSELALDDDGDTGPFRAPSVDYEAYADTGRPRSDVAPALVALTLHLHDELAELDREAPGTARWWAELLDVLGTLTYLKLWLGAHPVQRPRGGKPVASAVEQPLRKLINDVTFELSAALELETRGQGQFGACHRASWHVARWAESQVARKRWKRPLTVAALQHDLLFVLWPSCWGASPFWGSAQAALAAAHYEHLLHPWERRPRVAAPSSPDVFNAFCTGGCDV